MPGISIRNRRWILVLLFGALLASGVLPLQAQYVRRNHYSTEQQRRMQYALDDWISYMQSNQFTSIAVGTSYIYFGTSDGGILRYNLYQNYWDYPFTTSNGLPSNHVLSVAYDDGTGYLWAVTDVDVAIYQPAQREWLRRSQAVDWNYTPPQVPEPTDSKSIAYNVFYPEEFLSSLPDFFVNGDYQLTVDWKIIDQNFDEFKITGFLRDQWERVWFLIEGLGIGIGDWYSQRIEIFPYGLTNITPRTMEYQNRDMWIGGDPRSGEGRGIVHWLDKDGSWEYFRSRFISSLPSDFVRDIAVTGDSAWFASDYGVSLYDGGKDRWQNFSIRNGLPSSEIISLLVAKPYLYVGTIDGLAELDLHSGTIQKIKAQAIDLASIYGLANQGDTLWTATNRGIFRRLPAQTRWDTITVNAPIQDLPVSAVQVFGSEVWFASPGGIFWLDTKTDQWQSFPQVGMEVSGPFTDIEVNDISAWVSSSDGLLKYDRKRKYWVLFTTQDGLLSNRCYHLMMDGNYIWIANEKGITQFYWNSPNRID